MNRTLQCNELLLIATGSRIINETTQKSSKHNRYCDNSTGLFRMHVLLFDYFGNSEGQGARFGGGARAGSDYIAPAHRARFSFCAGFFIITYRIKPRLYSFHLFLFTNKHIISANKARAGYRGTNGFCKQIKASKGTFSWRFSTFSILP